MSPTKIKIATAADRLFAERGFAEPGVEAIREAADVSIRTLYKHYPSREAMIVGALAFRHERYLAHLRDGGPDRPGERAVLHLFAQVETWMATSGARGCLFVQALASHPESAAIHEEVEQNKRDVKAEIARRLPAPRRSLLPMLFLLHEGMTTAATSLGASQAGADAASVVKRLFSG